MSDGSLDDMNATPLGKLPAPMVQNNKGKPSVEVPSYRDLLRDVDTTPPQAPAQAPPPPPPPPAPSPPVHPDYGAYQVAAPTYATQNTYMPQVPSTPQYMAPPPPPQYHQPYPDYEPLPPEPPAERPQGGLLTRLVRSNKSTLVVVAVVFVLLAFVNPRLARVSRLAAADGSLSLLGKLAAAALAGASYRLAVAVV